MGQLSVLGSILVYLGTFGISGIICKANIQNKFLKLFLVIIPPLYLATFRNNVGYDYGSYITGYYNSFDITYKSIIEEYKFGDPIAFVLLTKFATTFESERVYLMLMALFSLVPGVIYILREWDNSDIQPLIMFVFLFEPYAFSFSACKQGIALSFLMFSLTYVYKRKPIKFALCVAVAFLFHSTAVVFLFVYFFLNGKGDLSASKKFLIIIGCLFVIMNLEPILGNIMDGRYEGYAINTVEGKNRTFWLYSLMAIVFLYFRKTLVKIDKRNELLIMMLVVGAICQYLGFFNAFTKRIGEYFLMSQAFLLPQSIYLFTEESKQLVKVLIIIYIVAIFLIATPIAPSGMGFVPYQYKLW